MTRELRDYQVDALEAIRQSVGQGVRRLVVQAPCGAGKTLLSAAIVAGAQRKGNRMCFVVPAISLVDQTLEEFSKEGITDIGVIQANHTMTDWSKPVQICSIQTIHRRDHYPEAKVVIFDECHNLHKEHVSWLGTPGWEKTPFIGLSATPWTKGLGRHFESLLVMSTTKQLIEGKYLAPFRVFASDHPDLSDVKVIAGDYHEGQLSEAMQGGGLTANIIKTWQDKWGKDKTLCFGVDCAHAKSLQERFLAAGVTCGYQDARTKSDERREIKRKFHNGEYQVVCNVGTLTTGIDWDVRCLILARPTKSEILFTQIIGRALRTAPGKEFAMILDHSDTTSRLGFVTDIHHEALHNGRLAAEAEVIRKPPLPKPCPQCDCLIPPGVKLCPACGFERKVEPSGIYERDGALVEYDPTAATRSRGKAITYTMAEKAAFYAQLKGYGQQLGYKSGWPAMQYMKKFGAWPDRSIKHIAAATPGAEVRSYIKSQLIAYARSKRAETERQGNFLR